MGTVGQIVIKEAYHPECKTTDISVYNLYQDQHALK